MPFYFKVDGSWTKLTGPTDIHDEEGRALIGLYPSYNDPGKVNVAILDRGVIVTTERMDIIFPGEQRLVNRDDIFIKNLTTGEIRAVIHSEKPIKTKK